METSGFKEHWVIAIVVIIFMYDSGTSFEQES